MTSGDVAFPASTWYLHFLLFRMQVVFSFSYIFYTASFSTWRALKTFVLGFSWCLPRNFFFQLGFFFFHPLGGTRGGCSVGGAIFFLNVDFGKHIKVFT